MDEYDKIIIKIVDDFFEDVPELKPMLRFIQPMIEGGPHITFFGNILVLIVKALSELTKKEDKNTRVKSQKVLQRILLFLDKCLQSETLITEKDNDFNQLLASMKVQAGIFFTENLYKSGDQYQAISDLAPQNLKSDIARVEKYYGIPEFASPKIYKLIYEAVFKIVTEK